MQKYTILIDVCKENVLSMAESKAESKLIQQQIINLKETLAWSIPERN